MITTTSEILSWVEDRVGGGGGLIILDEGDDLSKLSNRKNRSKSYNNTFPKLTCGLYL